MATYYARKAGNINAADVWATTPTGTASNLFPTFTNADVLMANSFTITVNVSTTVAEVRNDITGGATVGGTFALTDGVTLSANVFTGTSGSAGVSLSSTSSASVNGNITVPSTSNGIGVQHSGTGVLTISSTSISAGLNTAVSASSGTVNCTATNITAGNGTNCHGITALVANVNASQITGGSNSNCVGVNVTSAGTITGLLVGGSNATAYGANTPTSGTLTITGSARGGTQGAGVNNTSGVLNITRAIGNGFGAGSVGSSAVAGVSSGQNSQTNIEQIEYGILGQSPTSGPIRLKKANTNVAVFNLCDTAGSKTLIDATANAAMPAASNVRSGVSYASGALTGSCAVPAASSVASGVPVDATTGTAVLTLADVQSALTAQGLTSARAGNLDNLDATVSSRLSPSGTLARVTLTDTATTLTNAPTVPTAAEIATAVEGSILNEADGQAVLNAIVGAIGNQNLSEVSLVAAVRADLERIGGKLDSIPTSSAPSASAVAGAVRTELGVELGRLDASVSSRLSPSGTLATVTNLTNAPASVTPSDIWSHSSRTLTTSSGPTAAEIRQEMDTSSTKLANLDAAISTRMAASEATKLDSIKGKTDLLNTDRLSQVATTNIVGTLLAQANS